LEAIQNGWEQKLRIEREQMKELRMLQATRDRMRLAIEEHSREHAGWKARQARTATMEHRVNLEFINKQSSFSIGYRRESNALDFAETIKMLGPCHRPWHYGGKHSLLNVAICLIANC
jgi:hypothetical protein